MIVNKFNRLVLSRTLAAVAAATLALSGIASAQSLDQVRDRYPELANLLNSIDVTQAATLETIVAINNDPSTQQERLEFAMHM
ncbi:MAG: hypothetical protein RL120_09145, partial [Gammaproteobacteria bacterium]